MCVAFSLENFGWALFEVDDDVIYQEKVTMAFSCLNLIDSTLLELNKETALERADFYLPSAVNVCNRRVSEKYVRNFIFSGLCQQLFTRFLARTG